MLALLLESPQGTALCVFCCYRPLPTPVPQWVLKGSPRCRPLQAPPTPTPRIGWTLVPSLPGMLSFLQALT